MNRRAFLTITSGALAGPLAVDAQQASRVYKLGVLSERAPDPTVEERWRSALRKLRYVDGENVTLEFRFAAERFDRLGRLAGELVQLKVDMILTASTPTALAAKKSTSTIPIITQSADPVGAGLVASLARPGSNVTGVFIPLSELGAKRLQLLREAVPNLDNVAIVWNPDNPTTLAQARNTEAAARSLGIATHSIEVRGHEDLAMLAVKLEATRARGFVVMMEPVMLAIAPSLADLALKRRLPASHAYRAFVEAGGLMSYGVSLPDVFELAAIYVDRVLKGARPETLPMEQPRRYEFLVNLKTAKALGLTISPSLLLRADQVIE